MSLINQMKLKKIKAAGASNSTTIYSDVIDMGRCEGVLFMTVMPDAEANSNFLKAQVCDVLTFDSGVVDIIGAKAAPAADGDIVALDVSELPKKYVRAAIVKGGAAEFAAGAIFAAKYGLPKLPAVNNGSDGGVGVSVETITTATPTGTIVRPDITSPAANAINVALNAKLTSSTYAVRDVDEVHTKTDYQITEVVTVTPATGDPYIVIDWAAAVVDTKDKITALTELQLAGTELVNNTKYATRVCYYNAKTGFSDWSPIIEFTTVV